MYKLYNCISWLLPSKMKPHKVQYAFVISAWYLNYAWCIMQLTNCIRPLEINCLYKLTSPIENDTPQGTICIFSNLSLWVSAYYIDYAWCIMQLTNCIRPLEINSLFKLTSPIENDTQQGTICIFSNWSLWVSAYYIDYAWCIMQLTNCIRQ